MSIDIARVIDRLRARKRGSGAVEERWGRVRKRNRIVEEE